MYQLPGVIVEAIEVPHRDELSDMHAYLIKARKTLLFYRTMIHGKKHCEVMI